MLRPDYEKFLQIQSKLPENLFIINHESNKSYPCFFSKIMDKNTNFLDSTLSKYDIPRHIFIDVFPWDNINNWRSLKKKLKKTNKRLKRTTYKKYGGTLDTLKFIWYKGLYCFRDSNFFYKKMLTQTRSEEHTSELQSRPHLVCRLLPEKKNKAIAPRSPSPMRPIMHLPSGIATLEQVCDTSRDSITSRRATASWLTIGPQIATDHLPCI